MKQQGIFICLDARETLSNVMVNDWPSATRLEQLLNGLSEGTTKLQQVKRPRLVVCGELAPTLWVEGKTEAAIQLGRLWDEATRTFGH